MQSNRDGSVGTLALVVIVVVVAAAIVLIGFKGSSQPLVVESTNEPAGEVVPDNPPDQPSSAGVRNSVQGPASLPLARYNYDKAALSDSVSTILDIAAGQPARAAAVRKLSNDLSEDDVNALYWFLAVHREKQDNLKGLGFFSQKNEVLEALIDQRVIPNDLGYFIIEMAKNTGQDLTWRDYCYQHIAQYAQRRWPGSELPSDPKDREGLDDMISELEAGVSEVNTSISGTSLIGLQSILRQYPELDDSVLVSAAIDLVSRDSTPSIAKVTALQVCSEHSATEVLPHARRYAASAETIPLQLSAIAYLGQNGTEDDVALLSGISKSLEDKYPAKAAAEAVEKLHGRLGADAGS